MNLKPSEAHMDKTGKLTPARRFLRMLMGLSVDRAEAARGRLLLEPLESRQMLAGDVEWLFTSGEGSSGEAEPPAFVSSTNVSAEGEAAPDLVAFAKALNDAGVSFFGAAWCRFCTDQKALFEDGKEELPFVEVTNPDRTLNEIGIAEEIESFPTWEFPDGTRATGVLTLEEISTRSGVAIPQSDNPIFATIGDLTVEIGSPLHVPIDAYDPGGGPLTVTVSVSDPSLLQATVLQNNRSARMNVSGWGEMVFELFEDKAGRATSRFIELAQSGFYDQSDTNSVPFHRVIDNFVIQGGDPTGTGAGGSPLGDFDDAFNADLQHNRTGVLSYAKSFDDTNDSQFFITEGQQRHLDSNHSVFGQLVEGDAVREAISETALSPGGSTPLNPIIIDSVEIFTDTENSLVMLKPTGSGTGTTDVVFTVTDGSGNSYTEVVTVTIVADANNFRPFLADIAPVTTPAGIPAVIQLGAIDPENDPVVYEARVIDASGATATVDQATAQVTVTPAAGYSGQVLVEVAVRSSTTPTSTNDNTRSQTMDLQVVPVNVGPNAPTAITLNAASDTGLSSSDGITNTAPVTFTVSGVTPGATVEVLSGDTQIGVGLAAGTTVSITTNNFAALGPQSHTVSARQSVNGITSSKSPTITVVYDTTAPAVAPSIPTQAIINQAYSANIQQAEEGNGLRYSVVSGPTGLVVDAVTGVVLWTPTAGQAGDHELVVRYTDVAGNATEQTFTINVGAEPLLSVRLEITDLEGNVLNNLVPGQEFNVRVYAKDERLFGEGQGVYALYLDMFYDAGLAEPAPFTPSATELEPDPTETIFEYSAIYTNGKSGDYAEPGLIDEAGVFASTTSFLGATERFVFSARLRALAAGTLVISTDPAEGSGHDIALFNRDEAVPANQVVYGAATIEISSSFTPTDDEFTVAEDSQSTSLDLLANDEIIQDGIQLSLVSVQSPTAQGGTATVSGSAVLYTPAANFSGVDTFTYTVQDQNGVQLQANVTVTVTSVNDAPTANDDVFTASSGSSENLIDVLANDTAAPDSDETLQVISVSTSTAGGIVEVGTNGADVRYTPPANFEGTDTFTYTISDGSLTDSATVTVTVGPANAPPTAVNDSFTIFEDAAAADYDVLANDSNDDADETFALVSVGAAANGTASLSSDGTKLRYQPNPNFNGTDTVTYTIQDSNGAVATATVTFTVTPVNDAPPAPAIVKSVVKGTTAREIFSVTELDSQNVDLNESLTVSVQGSTTAGGTVTASADSRSLFYTPVNGDYVGPDSFTYTIEDEGGLVATGTMSISVLDYVPREISVTTQIDGNMRLGQGLVATLAGFDYQGTAVSQAAAFDQMTGEATFSELPPGDYEITIPSLPFVEGGQQTQRFSVQSDVEETTGETLETEFGGVRNNYLSVRDFIGATPPLSMFAVVRPGESHAWSMMSKNAEMPGNPTLSLSADGQTVTLEIDTADGGRQRASFPISDSRVDARGTEDGYHLLRVNVDPEGLSFTTVNVNSNATPAEGEAPANVAAQDVVMTTSVAGEGEGFSPATAQVESSSGPNTVGDQIANRTAVPEANAPATESEGVPSIGKLQIAESFSAGTDSSKPETTPVSQAFVASDEAEETLEQADGSSDVESETLVSTSGAAKLAVDAAMDSLLPQLELRSEVAESLADAEEEGSTDSVDTVFGQLVDPQFRTN